MTALSLSSPSKLIPVLCIPFLLGITLGSALVIYNNSTSKNVTVLEAVTIDATLFEQQLQDAQRLYESGNYDDALTLFNKLLQPYPQYAKVHMMTALTYLRQQEYNGAQWHARQALTTNPNLVTCHLIIGQCLSEQGQAQRAIDYYETVLKTIPQSSDLHYHTAKEYMALKKYTKSRLHAQEAHTLNPHNVYAVLTLGYLAGYEGDLTKAAQYFQQACTMNPTMANAHYNLGNILKNDNQLKSAIAPLKEALRLKPGYPDAHIALAHCYWGLGDFEMAWEEYAHRWSLLNINPESINASMWHGEPLRGKTIMLFSEQGLGDTFQFVRYAQLLKAQGATVVCKVPKPLQKILSLCPYLDQVVTKAPKTFDTYAGLMSLPRIMHTTIDTVPNNIPYLYADKQLTNAWKQRLAQDKNIKIGLCWFVDQTHESDKLPPAYRSIDPTLFGMLANIPGVSFYSLQKFNGEDQLKAVPASLNLTSFHNNFDEEHGRFMDTAALIQNLDLIIAADTSIVHLAGGLGKPVWMLLPYTADCRWMLNRSDSVWYPTMKIFRTTQPGDWTTAMHQVAAELKQFMVSTKKSGNALAKQ